MKKICVFSILIILISFSCGGKDKVKPSADSIMTQNALHTLNVIKDAYQKKNRKAIQENSDPILLDDLLKELFFEEAELSFAPRMVRISASNITVHLNWQGKWIVKGTALKNRGVSSLVFQRETVKLIRIDGDNPFRVPLVR